MASLVPVLTVALSVVAPSCLCFACEYQAQAETPPHRSRRPGPTSCSLQPVAGAASAARRLLAAHGEMPVDLRYRASTFLGDLQATGYTKSTRLTPQQGPTSLIGEANKLLGDRQRRDKVSAACLPSTHFREIKRGQGKKLEEGGARPVVVVGRIVFVSTRSMRVVCMLTGKPRHSTHAFFMQQR